MTRKISVLTVWVVGNVHVVFSDVTRVEQFAGCDMYYHNKNLLGWVRTRDVVDYTWSEPDGTQTCSACGVI